VAAVLVVVPATAQHGHFGGAAAHHSVHSGANGPSAGTTREGKATVSSFLTDPHHHDLVSRLNSLLPSGMTASSVCSGLKSPGQCVAFIHVAHNRDLSASQITSMQAAMAGGKSLGGALQSVDPQAKAKAEVRKAKGEAKSDLSEGQS
jgi:hypothetical protein